MGTVTAVRELPTAKATYLVSADSMESQKILIKSLKSGLADHQYELDHEMSTMPVFSVKATRDALQWLCQQPSLQPRVKSIEMDQVVTLDGPRNLPSDGQLSVRRKLLSRGRCSVLVHGRPTALADVPEGKHKYIVGLASMGASKDLLDILHSMKGEDFVADESLGTLPFFAAHMSKGLVGWLCSQHDYWPGLTLEMDQPVYAFAGKKDSLPRLTH